MHPLHHHVVQIELKKIRPTQVCIGFLEVKNKRDEWKKLSLKERNKLLQSHWFPSILGPRGKYYIIDHHHLGMALHLEKQRVVNLTVLKDFSWLDLNMFWRVMEFHQWAHPFNEKGQRISFSKLPTRVDQLKDDPYRSLAGQARDLGAFAKDTTPFSEFLWADFFRSKIPKSSLEKWDKALKLAMRAAGSDEASYLPGWTAAREVL
jgi:hypothetical protein